MAKVGHGIVYYSEMDVPGYPVKMDGITYFIYFNIFFSGKGHGRMNQFVPQLSASDRQAHVGFMRVCAACRDGIIYIIDIVC